MLDKEALPTTCEYSLPDCAKDMKLTKSTASATPSFTAGCRSGTPPLFLVIGSCCCSTRHTLSAQSRYALTYGASPYTHVRQVQFLVTQLWC